MVQASPTGCQRLHELLQRLPLCDWQELPSPDANGVYFFYERGETCTDHGADDLRIVRVGTNIRAQRALRPRLRNHYRTGGGTRFRRWICHAIARQQGLWAPGMKGWGDRRFDMSVQEAATAHLQEDCWFRWVSIDVPSQRVRFEKRCIGSVAVCERCSASPSWLGHHAGQPKIHGSGLWIVDHVDGVDQLQQEDFDWLSSAL